MAVDEAKMVIVVRADLKKSKGKAAAQAAQCIPLIVNFTGFTISGLS